MEAHGSYNRNSRVQAAGLLPAVQLFEHAAARAALALDPEPILIADYGSSAGHNSLAPVRQAIQTLRKRTGRERAISVVHTDLPSNDFSGLFELLDTNPESYLTGDPQVFVSAVGRSFYRPLLPLGSVTLGWSSWAVQWLSQIPGVIGDHVQVACSQNTAARQAFASTAAADWEAFLTCRADELRPGGRLVVLTMALDEEGNFGYGPLLDAMYDGLKALVAEGLISPEELRRMVIPTIGRSCADLSAPFQATGTFAGLSIEHLEVFSAEDRIWAEFEADSDARAFGAKWAAFPRASVFPTLASSLDGGGNDPRSAAFFEGLEARLAATLTLEPKRMMIPLAKLALVRV